MRNVCINKYIGDVDFFSIIRALLIIRLLTTATNQTFKYIFMLFSCVFAVIFQSVTKPAIKSLEIR